MSKSTLYKAAMILLNTLALMVDIIALIMKR
jgi:hypothetical protein